MDQQQRSSARPVVWAVVTAAVAALLVGAIVGGVDYARSGGHGHAGASPRASTPAPRDKATVEACRQAARATGGQGAAARRATEAALQAAGTSDVLALREIRVRNERRPGDTWAAAQVRAATAAYEISTWCLRNGLG